ncbi:CHAT domain-containing protein [Gulosibacter macacae]|uniref:CHAT domain-containing protein n=1 Tax=Gulosibacter macacae TaxID=2488791 RepID=A0A3P3W125_9MICO|nr:CHAT domain-containing protein [Gulosibacter macacae]RRJ88735.1 CHAT domain-containing protein [Gulosibacter macacae]
MQRALLIKYAEAGAENPTGYFSWRWNDRPQDIATARIRATTLTRIDELLSDALPEPRGEETPSEALERALRRGALAHPESTAELGAALADALLPPGLLHLLDAPGGGAKPRLRIQPSPTLARVPWALLRPAPNRRPLAETATIETNVPAAIAARAKQQNAFAAGERIVAVIDPRVPGQAATGPLGSVLGRPTADDPLASLLDYGERLWPRVTEYEQLARRTDTDRHWLRDACADAARLLYVGHVTAADLNTAAGEQSALHLCCRDEAGRHDPLTAGELVNAAITLPPRCALIACGSGSDLRSAEPMGLALAAMLGGARLVTACAWTVPTDLALASFAGELHGRSPLRELILAVDRAHEGSDPAADLAAWQAERAEDWASGGAVADSPLLWATLNTLTLGSGS